MSFSRRRLVLTLPLLPLLAACGRRRDNTPPPAVSRASSGETPEMRRLVDKWAAHHQIPRELLHRVIMRESRYNASARNGPYYGLMQILPQTARTMGHRGSPEELLDAETNLRYAGKYLRGAWLVSDRNMDRAVGWYARGYYYEAKKRGLLVETGLKAG